MEHQETLQTIAEVAVALAGFTGIAVAFGGRAGRLAPGEQLRVRTLLRASISALFCSFVPTILSFVTSNEPYVWQGSCAVLATVLVVNLTVFWVRGRGTTITRFQQMAVVVGVLVAIVLIVAALGYIEAASHVFVIGLVWQLIVAAQNFVLLVVEGLSSDA